MANKRMFSLTIIDTDAFLEMPLSSQALYFHLNMKADDDGFVGNPKMICRTVGASEDDLKLLLAKRFILLFDDGVIVIKHWRIHNSLGHNRYKETTYTEDKALLKIKSNNAYTFDESGAIIDDSKLIKSAKRQIDATKTNDRRDKDEQKTNTDKNRIDKNRIDKNNNKPPGGVVYFPNNEGLNKAFIDYVDMRKKIKAPMTERAIELAISKLQRLGNGDINMMIEILHQSVMNDWKGLFEINQTRQQPKNKFNNFKQRDYDFDELERKLLGG